MKHNPYYKYLTKEDHLQMQVCTYLETARPDIFFFHTPNEGKRTKFQQYKAKMLRIRRGVPDLLIFGKRVIAMELKIKPNKPTKYQQDCLERLKQAGCVSAVCYTLDEAVNIIEDNC